MELGIYQIRNSINNKIYIGSAVNFKKRKSEHFSKLKNNKYHSNYLQNAYNKHGKDNFVFEELEYCDKNELIKREQFYLDQYLPDYNTSIYAGNQLGYRHKKESKEKISNWSKINLKGEKNGMFGKKHSEKSKKLMSINSSGSKNPMSGKKHSKESIEKMKKNKKNKRAILQFNKNGKLIKEWGSVMEASRYLNVKPDGIYGNLKGKSKSSHNYIWKYKE